MRQRRPGGCIIPPMEPSGKTALVTGASRRIGASIASALAAAGANLLIHSRQKNPEAEELAESCRRPGIAVHTTHQDFSDCGGTELWFQAVQRNWGPVDILVNSASSYQRRGYREIDEEHLRHSAALHVMAPLIMMRGMDASGRPASIINILDTRITDRDPRHADYHLTKRALFTLTRDLAIEYAPRMRINAVAPGIILPPAGKGPEWLERTASSNPLNTHGCPEDIVRTVLFLLRSPFITGEVIFVDGGRHLKGNLYAF